jgi:hypothetical protein
MYNSTETRALDGAKYIGFRADISPMCAQENKTVCLCVRKIEVSGKPY